jgi:hypothetical protein
MTHKTVVSQASPFGTSSTGRAGTAGLNALLVWGVLLVLAVWTVLQFFGVGAGGSFEFWGVGRAMGVMEILLVASLVLNGRHMLRPTVTTAAVLWWVPWVFVNVAVSVSGDVDEWLIAGAMPVLLWPLAYLFFYSQARRNQRAWVLFERYFVLLAVTSVALFFSVFRVLNADRVGAFQQVNAVYYPLLILPWALVVRKPSWRVVAVMLIALAVIFSLKRTAIVALAVTGAVYVIIEMIQGARASRLRSLVLLAALCGGAAIAYVKTGNPLGAAIAERFVGMREDGGSGRLTIYSDILEELNRATAQRLVFGHGHYASLERFGVTAHNDFLEVTFDYGILGLFLYVWLHVCVIRKARALHRNHSPYAPAFGASYALFLVVSMTSHLIIYPTYFSYLAAFWGTVEGITRQRVGRGAIGGEPKSNALHRGGAALFGPAYAATERKNNA